jgi:Mn-dependent DtxR family transcriptional regulator
MKLKPGKRSAEESIALILDCEQFKTNGVISVEDAANILGMSKSAAWQFVNEMADAGYLDKLDGKPAKYRKSMRHKGRNSWRRYSNKAVTGEWVNSYAR